MIVNKMQVYGTESCQLMT